MRFWIREIAGWLLVGLGLYMFFWVYDLCQKGSTVIGPILLTIISLFVFRGGIHLLKVAVAARICQQTQDRLYPAAPAARGRGAPFTVPPGTIIRESPGSGRASW
jgi:hypothetical protein